MVFEFRELLHTVMFATLFQNSKLKCTSTTKHLTNYVNHFQMGFDDNQSWKLSS